MQAGPWGRRVGVRKAAPALPPTSPQPGPPHAGPCAREAWALRGAIRATGATQRPPPGLTPTAATRYLHPHPNPHPTRAQAKKGSVELRRYPASHPFAQLQGSDNIIAFTTQRYERQPLNVRGPGAGADVTAGGVFSDLLRLAAYLGAPS